MLLKGEIPSITKLDTSAALTTVANKIPNVNDLVTEINISPHLIIISFQIMYLTRRKQQKR